MQFDNRFLGIAEHQLFKQFKSLAAVGQADHFLNNIGFNDAGTERNGLIKQRQSIASRTVGGFGNHMQGFVLGFKIFGGNDFVKQFGQIFNRQALQIKTLTTGKHGYRNFADFRGGENKFNMSRRLFQRFQQCVEGVFREHVHFVDNINFITRIGRLVTNAVQNLADIVNTGAGGRIKFHNVNMPPGCNGFAVFTNAAGMNGRTAFAVQPGAVQGFGNQTGGRCFADAADSG